MILAGDVGGTKTALALFPADAEEPVPLREGSYPSAAHPGLAPILREFLGGDAGRVRAACVGVAGPVLANRCAVPNLPWIVGGEEVARETGLPGLALVNDLEATALALPLLRPDDLVTLNEGMPVPGGVKAVIAAGTGLGMAIVPPDGTPLPGEGGHAGFAPRGALERELLARLEAVHGRVSRERVVSGPGLERIHAFLAEREGLPSAPLDAEEIGRAGVAGSDERCARALEIFLSAYGSAAGDLALTTLARGGVYVAGGIAPKVLPALLRGGFLEAFLDKGRFRDLLLGIPLRVVTEPGAAVRGAWRRARESLPTPPGAP